MEEGKGPRSSGFHRSFGLDCCEATGVSCCGEVGDSSRSTKAEPTMSVMTPRMRASTTRQRMVESGGSQLHFVAINGDVNQVRRLVVIERCPIDARDHNGNTALHLACQYGQLSTVDTLVLLGADLDAKNHKGHNAFAMARDERTARYLHWLQLNAAMRSPRSQSPATSPRKQATPVTSHHHTVTSQAAVVTSHPAVVTSRLSKLSLGPSSPRFSSDAPSLESPRALIVGSVDRG